ncbi:hypothetical protein [Rubrivirga sp.]|uniref:hypothetical protein n=1 Tax=Rubrivirga sp. TaxID=1885344 RepID=UPI003C7666BC
MLSVTEKTGLFQAGDLEGVAAMAASYLRGETDSSRWDVFDGKVIYWKAIGR